MSIPHLSHPKIFSTLTLLLLMSTFALAQQKGTVTGKVLTTNKEAAENVTVNIKGTDNGTITDDEGKYSFRLIPGNYILVVTHVGFKNKEVYVTVKAGQVTKVETITVNAGVNSLKEVSVSGNRTNKFSRKKSIDVAKMPLDNLENPQSYSTVGKELLQEQAVFSADDAVKNSPGITQLWAPTNRAGDGGSYYSLRGFTVQTTMRNGLSGIVTSGIDAANLEKIEVIKGPSGSLYGSSMISYGGLINRVTKKPYETQGGEISFSTGSYNMNRLSVDYNTPLDSAHNILFRINSAYNQTNTFQDNGYSKSYVFDPSVIVKVNDRLTLHFDAEFSHGTGTNPPFYFFNTSIAGLGVNSANQLSIDYKRSYQSNDITSTSDNANFFAQADYKISDNWKSQTNISSTYGSANGYQTYFYLLPKNDSISRNVWGVTGNSSTVQIQQNFIGDFKIGNLRNRLVAGIDFLSETSKVSYIDPNGGSDLFDVINTKGPIPNYGNFNKSKIDSLFSSTQLSAYNSKFQNYTTAAYASDVLNITDNFLAMASLRVNHFTTKPIDDPTSGTSSQGFNQTTLSPKLGLVYQVIKDKVSLFGNYMNGFSSPGYYIAYNTSTSLNENKLFKAEEANQWEGGVKLDLFDGKLSSTISYYDISVKNKVRPDAEHANASIQNGTQKSRGVEGEVIANPLPGFNILVGYAHNKAFLNNDQTIRPEGTGPANSGNFWVSYSLTHGEAKGLGLGLGGNYAGATPVIDNGPGDRFFLPSYTIFNTGVFFNKEKYRISLNVNNLGNKEYYTGYTTVNPQMLRQVIGSVAYRF